MKVVVTGGSGFLGSHVVRQLASEGHEVFIIDHFKRDRERFLHPEAQVFKYNVGHEDIPKILEDIQPDAIIHLAAQISVTKSLANPIFDVEENVMNGLHILEAAKNAGAKKVVFASSGGAIYGDHPVFPTPELNDVKPLSPYGIGKLMFEHCLRHYHEAYGMSTISLRFANLYGPHQQVIRPQGEGAVVPIFLEKMLITGEPLTVFGDGTSSRDFVYVEDAADAIMRALKSEEKHLVVNIGTGKETTMNELLALFTEIHGAEHPLVHEPFRIGEVRHSVLTNDLAKEKLGWEPRMPLKEGLQKTYDWFKEKFGKKDV
jgi:UDP-glucose 4-epimerase